MGCKFVKELAVLFRSYGEGSALECIALKAAMLCCTLLLQRPYSNASSKDFISSLQRRLTLWREGNIDTLLSEGRTIQRRIPSATLKHDSDRATCNFIFHMLKGNVRAALALLDDLERAGTPLHLGDPVSPDKPSWTVFDELQKKHPLGRPAQKEALLPPSTPKPDFIQLFLML